MTGDGDDGGGGELPCVDHVPLEQSGNDNKYVNSLEWTKMDSVFNLYENMNIADKDTNCTQLKLISLFNQVSQN